MRLETISEQSWTTVHSREQRLVDNAHIQYIKLCRRYWNAWVDEGVRNCLTAASMENKVELTGGAIKIIGLDIGKSINEATIETRINWACAVRKMTTAEVGIPTKNMNVVRLTLKSLSLCLQGLIIWWVKHPVFRNDPQVLSIWDPWKRETIEVIEHLVELLISVYIYTTPCIIRLA